MRGRPRAPHMGPSQQSMVASSQRPFPPPARRVAACRRPLTPLLAAPQVPTLRTISEDMDKVKLGSNAAPGKEIYDTGLAPYVQYMDRFLARLGDAARAEKVREITANKQSSLDF